MCWLYIGICFYKGVNENRREIKKCGGGGGGGGGGKYGIVIALAVRCYSASR